MPRTRIKICGLYDAPTAAAAVQAGADALGFVFVKSSPRFIEPAEAWAIIGTLPPFVASIGLYVDATVEEFCDLEELCPTNYAQLHGTEPDHVARACGPGVIKAVRYAPATIATELRRWAAIEEVDAILVDGSAGGEGGTLDWPGLAAAAESARRDAIAGRAPPPKPLILAGGLTPQNVGDAIRAVRPYGVDVSSGVEKTRGVKDPSLIAAFCQAVRAADLT
jgi:phosphoribosylanthranilate isomerase